MGKQIRISVKGDRLVKTDPFRDQVIVIMAYPPRAWVKSGPGPWKGFYPYIPRCLVKASLDPDPTPPRPDWARIRTREERYKAILEIRRHLFIGKWLEFLRLFPEEHRRVVCRFEAIPDEEVFWILNLLARIPGLETIARNSPVLFALLASIRHFLPAQTENRWLDRTRALAFKPQRVILRKLGFHCSPKALSRLPPDRVNAFSLHRYRDFLARGGSLAQLGTISPGLFALLARRPRILEPLGGKALRELNMITDPIQLSVVTDILIDLQNAAVRLANRFPDLATKEFQTLKSLREFHTRLEEWCHHHPGEVSSRGTAWLRSPARFPPPPVPGDGLTVFPISSPEEARKVGAEMGNCIAGLIGQIASGKIFLYRISRGGQTAVASLIRNEKNPWELGSILGPGNSLPGREAKAQAIRVLQSQIRRIKLKGGK